MLILKINPQHRTFWDFPENGCEHAYDDDEPVTDEEYSGSFKCIHCNEILSYDVADIGD